jgi:hypothetical protein
MNYRVELYIELRVVASVYIISSISRRAPLIYWTIILFTKMPPYERRLGNSACVPYGFACHLRAPLVTCDHLRSGDSQVIASASHISICPCQFSVHQEHDTIIYRDKELSENYPGFPQYTG